MKLLLYSDGGSRGNPGRGACAFLIKDVDGKVLRSKARYLGRPITNNEAEYRGLQDALKEALALGADEVVVTLDSELVARQVQGRYAVKAANLRELYQETMVLLGQFERYDIKSAPREDPTLRQVDRLLNEELDICTFPKG